jgi:hypothetical protein
LPISTPAHARSNVISLVHQSCCTTDGLAVTSLHSDWFAILNQQPSRRGGAGRPIGWKPQLLQMTESHTLHPWAPGPYDWPELPEKEGRDD